MNQLRIYLSFFSLITNSGFKETESFLSDSEINLGGQGYLRAINNTQQLIFHEYVEKLTHISFIGSKTIQRQLQVFVQLH